MQHAGHDIIIIIIRMAAVRNQTILRPGVAILFAQCTSTTEHPHVRRRRRRPRIVRVRFRCRFGPSCRGFVASDVVVSRETSRQQ